MKKAKLVRTEVDLKKEERLKRESEKKFEENERKRLERESSKVPLGYNLTPEEEKKAIDFWKQDKENLDLRSVCRHVFGIEDLRTNEGRAIKEFFRKKNIRVKKNPPYQKKSYTLTDEEKTFIINNKELYESRIELIRNCLDDPSLNILSAEARAVNEFLEEIGYYDFAGSPEYLIDRRHSGTKSYKPPTSVSQAIKLVNSCVKDAVDPQSLTVREKRDMESLISYMGKNRFLRQINSYTNPEDRTTFENSFISYVYDKGDLTQEELDQYIILSTEVVTGFQVLKLREKTLKAAEDLLDSDDNETKSIGKGLVDHAAQLNTEYNQCIKRQESLFKNLTQKRAERLEELKGREYNLFNLVEAFREKENRDKMLKYAEKLRDESREKIQEYDEMSEISAMFLGMSAEEMLYG